ncbi:hypothetical protein LJR098_002726 [Rhizobium sp. LjRoot98]|uniref:hypothetical protein n=1 Tax=Rhizobium sp. LjRoot98 TaxID=3342345 RepID=UPI003ECE3947
MSIRENPTAFLNPEAMKVIMTADQLDLPPPMDARNDQPLEMAAGERYQIYSADRLRVGRYVVRSWTYDDQFGALAIMENMLSQSAAYLTTSQIVFLEKHRRLRPDTGQRHNDNAPGAAFRIPDAQQEKGARYLGYVNACFVASDQVGKPLTRGLIEFAVKQHATLIADKKPPCFNTVKRKIAQYCDGAFDPLVAIVPKLSSGNRTDRFCPQIEELLADAVEVACRLKSGDWKDAKEAFRDLLRLPENDYLRAITHNDKGRFFRPGDRTFQRRFGSVDKVQKALWRHGPAYAKKHFDIYLRQALPDHPLDIVDCDFTPIDVIVVDDERPIIYGRPHIIVFRDRKSGSFLGYSVSFKGATFETFLEGLKMAIMPKDMSQYPGLEWKQYGTFLRLGVDNDMALINDHVRFTLSQLGIQLVEYRPGHPWEKGAMERLFRILNQDAIHNLPGATMSKPADRDKFLEVNANVPKITLSELNHFLTHYICGDYHVSAHKGLGILRTLDGVPNQIWEQGIRHAKQRRPTDPDILVRAMGNVADVTIHNGSIRWDNLIYTHPDLIVVQADARNKTAVPGVNTTTYKAWRDPADLGEIHVLDHHNDRVIIVPIQSIDAWYAKGLRLYQHTQIVKFNLENGRDARDFEGAYDSFSRRLAEINNVRTSKRTRQALARFHAKASKKFVRSRVIEVDHNDPSGAGHMQLTGPGPSIGEANPASLVPQAPTMATPPFSPDTKPRTDRRPSAPDDGRKYDLDLSEDDDDITKLFGDKDNTK